MFTSRAEYRLLLRQDNADRRLAPHGFRLGLLPGGLKKKFERYKNAVEGIKKGKAVPPGAEDMEPWTAAGAGNEAKIEKEYAAYIDRALHEAENMKNFEHVRIPGKFDPASITGLSTEARQRFLKVRPGTLAQAARIPGVTPTDIQLLWVHLGRSRKN
jgi:tRNA uridine 5-carboxymethylaminomethyl modification enzyme